MNVLSPFCCSYEILLAAKPIRAGQHHMSGALGGIRPQAHMVTASNRIVDESAQKKKSILSGGAARGKNIFSYSLCGISLDDQLSFQSCH